MHCHFIQSIVYEIFLANFDNGTGAIFVYPSIQVHIINVVRAYSASFVVLVRILDYY